MNESYENTSPGREPRITADVTGAMTRGLREPGRFPRLSLGDSGLPSPDAHAVASLDTRATLGRILVEHRSRDTHTAHAIEQILVALGLDPRSERQPLDRIAEPNPDGIEPEPLSVQVSRVLRRRDVAAVSHETAVKLICAVLSAALPVPAGALDVQTWSNHEAGHDRAPTAAGYLQYLLERITAAVTA